MMNTDDELMDGEEVLLPPAEEEALQPGVPEASLAPGVESLAAEEDEGVPWEEQEDPYAGRDLPGESMDAGDAEEGEEPDVQPPPPFESADDGQTSPWPRREEVPPAAPADERARYWQRVLTGNPDTVPDDVRARAVADDAGESAEEREYRMLSTINRSWVADHSAASREEVRAAWPQQRAALAQRLGAADNEHELFTALSLEEREAPRREAGRAIYERAWRAGVL